MGGIAVKTMWEILRDMREDRDMTQRDVAEKLGVSTQQYSQYENGVNEIPLHRFAKLIEIFDVSADYLLGLTDYDPSDEHRKQQQKLTHAEQDEMHNYEEYLLWKRNKNSRTARP